MKFTEIYICGLPFKFTEYRRLGKRIRKTVHQSGDWGDCLSILISDEYWGYVINFDDETWFNTLITEIDSEDEEQEDADEYYDSFKLSNELKASLPKGAQQQKRRSL